MITHNIHSEGSGYNLDYIENYNLYYGLCSHSNRIIENSSPIYSHNGEHVGCIYINIYDISILLLLLDKRRRDENMDFEPYVGKPKFKTRRNGSHYSLRSQSRLNSQ